MQKTQKTAQMHITRKVSISGATQWTEAIFVLSIYDSYMARSVRSNLLVAD